MPEISNPISLEKEKNIINLSSAEFTKLLTPYNACLNFVPCSLLPLM